MEVRGGACRATTAPQAAAVSVCKAPTACHALFISVLANISAWCQKSGSADYLCPCFYSSSSATTSSRHPRHHADSVRSTARLLISHLPSLPAYLAPFVSPKPAAPPSRGRASFFLLPSCSRSSPDYCRRLCRLAT